METNLKQISIDKVNELLKNIISNNEIMFAWSINSEKIYNAELLLISCNNVNDLLQFKAKESSYFYLEKMVTGHGLINFFAPTKSLIFSSKLKKLDDFLYVGWPSICFLQNRRKTERLINLESTIDCKINIEEKMSKRNCFDLSEKGISFIVRKDEYTELKEDYILSEIILVIKGEKIVLSGRITSIDLIDPFKNSNIYYEAKRISVKFIEESFKLKNMIRLLQNAVD